MSYRLLTSIVTAAVLVFNTALVSAHEYWIEPVKYNLNSGERLVALLKNGQFFKGPGLPYIGEKSARFEMAGPGSVRKVPGRTGDNPAVNFKVGEPGLYSFAYASNGDRLTYNEPGKFVSFLQGKKLEWALEEHEAKGFPDTGVFEIYYRYAKTLVAVGTGEGSDRAFGMPLELVALTNPQTGNTSNGMTVQLLYKGRPLAGTNIQIYRRPNGGGAVASSSVTTNSKGQAVIPAGGRGAFLINAVHILEPRGGRGRNKPHWETLWASMTFELR